MGDNDLLKGMNTDELRNVFASEENTELDAACLREWLSCVGEIHGTRRLRDSCNQLARDMTDVNKLGLETHGDVMRMRPEDLLEIGVARAGVQCLMEILHPPAVERVAAEVAEE